MNVFYTNSNDLKNKVSELQIVAESRDCKVLGITETMFSSDIYDAEVSIPNFTLYRADRTTGKGGGSCIYVHNSITAHEVAINVPDCICVILELESINIAVFVIYRAPSLSLFNCQSMLDKLSMSMNNIAPETERIVMGDFKEVKDFLDKLNIWKSMGPDEIHPKLIRTLSNKSEFIYAVTDLFQKCYDSGELPAVWKQANITALHKKNEKSKASNYRPISLTCVLSKIFEKIVRNHILNHTAPMITTDQHGFRPRKSSVSNLLECMDPVSDILIRDGAADILYLDFQKAFDSVLHKRLLCKLRAYGITGKSLAIIREFLSERTFRVRIGSTFSDTYTVSSGVPQGTVLGPLLFLLFINDLPDGIRSFVSLFADDLKLVTSCKESNIAQSDIDKLNRWENDWLLRFNVKDGKCKALHIGSKNPKVKYIMNGEILPQIESEKDLGVHTDNNLDWSVHIETCVNKANSMVGWVKRSLFCRNKFVMLNVYKTLIRPHIEYAVQAWNLPAIRGNWKHILLLEDVQRTFTRLIDGIGILPYPTRLKILQLTTLLERRMRGDLIETFKILSGKVDYGQTLFRVSRSGANILKDKRSDRILSNRVANYWNKIPQSVKDADTVSTFKARLEKYKKETVSSGVSSHGHFWELSEILLSKIDNDNHDQCAEFMMNNPVIAKFKGINVS